MIGRGIFVHAALLGIAIGASLYVWTRDTTPTVSAGDVTVWNARAADVDRVTYESKAKKVSLEARNDAAGRWFLGTADSVSHYDDTGASPPKMTTFVSVAPGDKLAQGLAPLKALRDLGVIVDERLAEFGLKEPEGTVGLRIGGKERKFQVGAQGPGGGTRYVRDEGSRVVYALKAEILRDLEAGEGALSERELHAFKDTDIRSVTIVSNGKKREAVRGGPENGRFWADPGKPDTADETLANFVAKVDRLRPVEYLAAQPKSPPVVLRLEYQARGADGAFFEVAKVPPSGPAKGDSASAPEPKNDYVVRTERTRLWAKTSAGLGEQVEQDLPSVVR